MKPNFRWWRLSGALLIFAAGSPFAPAETVAFYRFEGTPGEAISSLEDSSGNENSAALAAGTPTYGSEVFTPILDPGALNNGSSGSLPGGTHFEDSDPVASGLATETFLDFTVEGFVNFGATLEGVESIVGMTETADGAEAFRDGFYLNKFFGQQFRVEAATVGGDYLVVESGTVTAETETWYHVAAVGDSTAGTLTLYVDYQEVGSATGFDGLFVAPETAGSAWLVGASAINNGQIVDQLNGLLDEVRFSNEALDPSEFIAVSSADSDGDGLIDLWELQYFRENAEETTQEILDKYDGDDDPDGDGQSNLDEFNGDSDPTNGDSVPGDIDGDGIDDLVEDEFFGDGDGLVTAEDLTQGPDDDFDRDFSSNGDEIAAGTLPNDAADWPDSDSDGMGDGWEVSYGLDPDADDADEDPDGDGSTNAEEHLAGSDPTDAAWSATQALLKHRWSFNGGSLADSVGGSDAGIIDPDDDPAVGGTATLGAQAVTLSGGARATSSYVQLGENLLSSLQDPNPAPVTIETWATHEAINNWGRIFAFGTDTGDVAPLDGSLFMTWTVAQDLQDDRVGWAGRSEENSGFNAPYLLGVPYHIVLTVVPAYFTDGLLLTGAEVSWYASPASDTLPQGHPLFDLKGSFVVDEADLSDLADSVAYLGRSMWSADATAAASYDEFRIWIGTLTETERELFHLLGPDNIDRTDSEPDGFPDAWELARFGDLDTATMGGDADGDGDQDEDELTNESDPNDSASIDDNVDGDLLEDFDIERFYFNNLLRDGSGDYDGDGVSDLLEAENFTDPTNPDDSPDLDGDGLPDGWEFAFFGNTDGNDLGNPDGDYDDNLTEYLAGTDPTDPFSGSDEDLDGIADYWEFTFFGDAATYGAADDPDGDLATNLQEFEAGSLPDDPDSVPGDINGDGVLDALVEFPVVFVEDDFDSYADATFILGTNGTNQLVDDGEGGNAVEYTATAGAGFLASGWEWVPAIQPGPNGANTSENLEDYLVIFDLTVTSDYVPPTIEVWLRDQSENDLEFADRSANLYAVAAPETGVPQTVTIALSDAPNTVPFGYEAGAFTPTIDEWQIRINVLDGAAPGDTEFSFTVDNFAVRTRASGGGGDGSFADWAADQGLEAGVNDGPEDNPDNDPYPNLLEFQLGGNPLVVDDGLVTTLTGDDEAALRFLFDRNDASEADTTLSFSWGTDLLNWNLVPIGATSSPADANGVVISVTEDGGASAEYDLIEVALPKANAENGRLFGRLEGTEP